MPAMMNALGTKGMRNTKATRGTKGMAVTTITPITLTWWPTSAGGSGFPLR
jgi:hypothetical protein